MATMLCKSESDTEKAAQELAKDIATPNIIFLNGTLGMGKTVFARALIRALCNQPNLEVVSPTFTIVQTYEAPDFNINHYDLYRIENPDEIQELGWEDAIYDGITIVEWPERLGAYKPSQYLDITLSNSDNNPNHREILIQQV